MKNCTSNLNLSKRAKRLVTLLFSLMMVIGFTSKTMATPSGIAISYPALISISADKAANSNNPVGGTWTSLGNIKLCETGASDFSPSQSLKTIVLSAPPNWDFKPGASGLTVTGHGSFTGAPTITITGYPTNTITITFSTSSDNTHLDTMIIANLNVKPHAGGGYMTQSYINRTAGTSTVAGLTNGSTNTITQAVGTLAEIGGTLQHFDFSSISTQTVNTNFSITITAKDQFGNTAGGFTSNATLSADAGFISPTSTGAFTAGVKTLNVALSATGSRTITVTSGAIHNTSGSFNVNGPHLLVVLPGETFTNGVGKSGTADHAVAGTSYGLIHVYALDVTEHIITTNTDQVHLTSTDAAAFLPANFSLVSGQKTFSVTFNTPPGPKTVTASDVTNNGIASSTSSNVNVDYSVPTIDANGVFPSCAITNDGDLAIEVVGTQFFHASVIRVGLTDLTTTYIDSTHLSATYPHAAMTAGNHNITVFNPTPGGGESAPFVFTVYDAPSITLDNANYTQLTPHCDFGNITFNAATGISNVASYQWQFCTDTTTHTVWYDFPGANSSSYTLNYVSHGVDDALLYRVIYIGDCINSDNNELASSIYRVGTINGAPLVHTADQVSSLCSYGSERAIGYDQYGFPNQRIQGGHDGGINIVPADPFGSYDYSIDGGVTWPQSDCPLTCFNQNIFSNLDAEQTFYVVIRDQASGCISDTWSVYIQEPDAIDMVARAYNYNTQALSPDNIGVTCNGMNDAHIFIVNSTNLDPDPHNFNGGPAGPIGGTPEPFYGQYYVFVQGRFFGNAYDYPDMFPGTYPVIVMDYNGCVSAPSYVLITEPDPIIVTSTTPDYHVHHCETSHIDLNATATGGNSDVAALGYVWVTPDLLYYTDQHTVDLNTPMIAGNYTLTVLDTFACSSAPVIITIDPTPVAQTVTFSGGGHYCTGGLGITISLANSELNVNYQLYHGLTPIGSPKPGTGSGFDFPSPQTTAGAYSVVATNHYGASCTNTMTGNVTITVDNYPTAYNVTGGGERCADAAGFHIGLDDSQLQVNYQLYLGATPVGSTVAGDGTNPVDFGVKTAAGTYTVVATNDFGASCSVAMTGSQVITVDALPIAYNVTGTTGHYCTGNGSHVGVSNSQTNVNYELYKDNTASGTILSGTTGSSLDFGLITVTGAYTVVATNQTGVNCTQSMTGTVTITIDPYPVAQNVTGGGYYCYSGSGKHVGVDHSQSNVSYQLYLGLATAGTPVAGDGINPVDFGLQTAAGTYTVVATNTYGTSCTTAMTGSVDIIINQLPTFTPTTTNALCHQGQQQSIPPYPYVGGSGPEDASVATFIQGGYDGSISVATNHLIDSTGHTFEYSKDNGAHYQSNILFSNLTATNTYSIKVHDITTDCYSLVDPITIGSPSIMDYEINHQPASCHGSASGYIWIGNSLTDWGAVMNPFDINYPIPADGPIGGTAIIDQFNAQPYYSSSVDNGSTFYGNQYNIAVALGNYQVIIQDGNGCLTDPPYTLSISEPPAIVLNVGADRTLCVGDNTQLGGAPTVSGGTIDLGTYPSTDGFQFIHWHAGNGSTDNYYGTFHTPSLLPPYGDSTYSDTPITDVFDTLHLVDSTVLNPTVSPTKTMKYLAVVADAIGCQAFAWVTVTMAATPLSVSVIGHTHVSCNGGSDGTFEVLAADGAGTYECKLDNGSYSGTAVFSSLAHGTYTVTAKDAYGCTATTSFTITEPDGLTATVTPTNITCNGANDGIIDITSPSGGYGTYDYSIDGGSTWTASGSYVSTGKGTGTYAVKIRDGAHTACTQTLGSVTITEPNTLSATVTPTNITCNGANDGIIDITSPSGGYGTYNYSIDGGSTWTASGSYVSTGKGTGTYAVKIRDGAHTAGTQTLGSVTITEPTALAAVSVSSTNVTCNGAGNGTITVNTPSGGYGTYEFRLDAGSWQSSGSFTGVNTGTFAVQMRDAAHTGCTLGLGNKTITEPTALTATVTQTNITCNGASNGIIDISAGGGYGTYDYSIDGGSTWSAVTHNTGLNTGTHDVKVRDAANTGCTLDKGNYTITQPDVLTTSTITSPTYAGGVNVKCFGGSTGSISYSATGGTTGYSYSWTGPGTYTSTSQNPTGLKIGTYNVTVTDNHNCTTTSSVTLSQPSAAVAVSVTNIVNTTPCSQSTNGSITLATSGGTTGYSYTWSSTVSWTPASGSAPTNLSRGTYIATASDANSCTATTTAIVTASDSIIFTTISIVQPSCNKLSAAGVINNGKITMVVSGGSNSYQYSHDGGSWSATNSFASLTTGTYTIVAKDGYGCLSAYTPTVVSEPSLVVQSGGSSGFTRTKTAITMNASGGTPGYNYKLNGGTFGIAATLSGLTCNTTYSNAWIIRDSKLCQSQVYGPVTTLACRDAADPIAAAATALNVYPNPANNHATVLFSSNVEEAYTIRLMDILGQGVLSTNGTAVVGDNQVELNLGNYAKGVYVVEVEHGGTVNKLRLVIQ